jgi:DNA-binding response OmpR family regulator
LAIWISGKYEELAQVKLDVCMSQFNEKFLGYKSPANTPPPKYKILVVDDDLELNTSFALLLEYDGHEVETAHTGEAALEKLAQNRFDLMISEYWLPRMRGDQLAALVKEQWPDLPIIMVTANFEEIHMEDRLFSGVHCLLDKPFTMDQLRQSLNWVMGHLEEKPADELEIQWLPGGHRTASDVPQDTRIESDN